MTAFGLFSLDHMKMKISEHVQYIFDWHTFSGNVNVSYTPNANEQWDFQFGGKNTYSEGDAFGSVPWEAGIVTTPFSDKRPIPVDFRIS